MSVKIRELEFPENLSFLSPSFRERFDILLHVHVQQSETTPSRPGPSIERSMSLNERERRREFWSEGGPCQHTELTGGAPETRPRKESDLAEERGSRGYRRGKKDRSRVQLAGRGLPGGTGDVGFTGRAETGWIVGRP